MRDLKARVKRALKAAQENGYFLRLANEPLQIGCKEYPDYASVAQDMIMYDSDLVGANATDIEAILKELVK